MAELEKEGLEEDYLDNLLSSVSETLPDEDELPVSEDGGGNEERMETLGGDEEDIESLLNMLNTEGMDEDLKEEDIDKITQGLDDIPDLSEIEDRTEGKGKKEKKKKEKKKKEKKRKLFSKKDKNVKEEIQDNISPEDNEQIIESVEESLEESFDLSDLVGLDDLDDIEDRSKKTEEKTDELSEEELKALEEERKAEKERKKQEKAEKKAEKKKIKAEKKAERKAKSAEKKRKKKEKEKPKVPEEKIKISVPVLFLLLSLMVGVILVTTFGGRYIWYNNHINDATSLLIDKKYTEAYNNVSGLKIKDKDMGLYRQLRTLMFIEKEYNSFKNCIKIDMDKEALDSLLKGVEKYHEYKGDAEEYGVAVQAADIYKNILNELSSTFGLSEDAAKELASIKDPQKYSQKIADLVAGHRDSINQLKN